MGKLWNALKNTWREKKDEAAEKLADPVRDGKFAIEDAKKQEAEFTRQVAEHIAAIKRMERDRAESEAQMKKYDKLAKTFAKKIEEGDDSQMKNLEAAAQKVEQFKAKMTELKKGIETNEGHRRKLESDLNQVRNRIATAEQNYHTLAARQKAAEMKKKLAESKAKLETGMGGLSALDELQNAVDVTETQAEAIEELAGVSDADLEAAAAEASASDLASKYLKK